MYCIGVEAVISDRSNAGQINSKQSAWLDIPRGKWDNTCLYFNWMNWLFKKVNLCNLISSLHPLCYCQSLLGRVLFEASIRSADSGKETEVKAIGSLPWLPINLASNPCLTVWRWIWLCSLSWAHECEYQDGVLCTCVRKGEVEGRPVIRDQFKAYNISFNPSLSFF